MSAFPIPPTRSPVVAKPPKQNNVWTVAFRIIQLVTFFLVIILVFEAFPSSSREVSNEGESSPAATEMPVAPPEATLPSSSITLNLIPPQAYQFSDEIALSIHASQIQNPKDITAELLKSGGSSFDPPKLLEIKENKVVIPPMSFTGAFKVKVALSTDPAVDATTDVTIAEPNWALMSMIVKPAIYSGAKIVLIPDITTISFDGMPADMSFTLGADSVPHKQKEEIPVIDAFAGADKSKLEMQFQEVFAEDGTAFRHALTQVIFAQKAVDASLGGTFNQYPVKMDDKGQPQEKIILSQLPECKDSLWSLGSDESGKEIGLAIGYVSLANLPNFLKDVEVLKQSSLPSDVKTVMILRPTSDKLNTKGCIFGNGAAGAAVYKLDTVDEKFLRVIIFGYYNPAP